MHRNDFHRTGEARSSTAERAGDQRQAPDRQPHQLSGACIAAEHADGESEHRVLEQREGEQAGDDAEREAPMHTDAGNVADHGRLRDRPAGGLERHRRVAHRPADQVVQHGDGDVVEQQRRDCFIDSAQVLEGAGERDPGGACGRACGADCDGADRRRQAGGRQPREHREHAARDQRALSADHQQAGARRDSRA